MNFLDPRLPDRFWDKAIPCAMSGCWLWIGAWHSAGYGQIAWDDRVEYAHRVTFLVLRGYLPSLEDDRELDHLCRTRCCVNPLHLEDVTHQVNCLRGESPHADNAVKNTCPNGHPYDTRITRGDRLCAICKRIQQRQRRGVNDSSEGRLIGRLTESQALEILGRSEHGEATRSIARRMAIARCTVRDVVIRKNWRHLG